MSAISAGHPSCEAERRAADSPRAARAWAVLGTVLDPEVPALSICDLGIVREVIARGEGLEVVLTPTYSGCPATEAIERSVREALEIDGLGPVRVSFRLAPAWTTDWMTPQGKEKLREYGIAPPGPVDADGSVRIHFFGRKASAPVHCPRCDSPRTERLSQYGSTACKAMYRCASCQEPFEHFKPI